MFREVLEGLISRVQEAQGAAMIGVDGIPIAEFPVRPGIDLEKIAAECTSLIKTAVSTGHALDHGLPQELVLTCQEAQTLLRAVTPEYYLCLVLDRHAWIGRARYELARASRRLEGELI
jgi:predicted regulator of Ras-like GTPase activity (Roadblock/LC7/MglB family)